MAKVEVFTEKERIALPKGFLCIDRKIFGVKGAEYKHLIRYLMPRRRYRRLVAALHKELQALESSANILDESQNQEANVVSDTAFAQPAIETHQIFKLDHIDDSDPEETVSAVTEADTAELSSTDIEEALAAKNLDELMANLEGIVQSYSEISINVPVNGELEEKARVSRTMTSLLRILIKNLIETRDEFLKDPGSLKKNIYTTRRFAQAISGSIFAELVDTLPEKDRPDLTFTRVNEKSDPQEILVDLNWYVEGLRYALQNAKVYGRSEKVQSELSPESSGETTSKKDTVELLREIVRRMKDIRTAIVSQKESYRAYPQTFYTAMGIIVRVTQAVPETVVAGLWERLPSVPEETTKLPLGRRFATLLAKEIGIKPLTEWEE